MTNLGGGGLNPIAAFALVGVAGIGAQWLAWRFRLPGIVLMLAVGLILGPATGIFIPRRDIGSLTGPMISLAVAVILFEGGLTLSFHQLADARPMVRRLVCLGVPFGWLFSTLVLVYGAGLGWAASLVFGGLMIVTGPTVIAPLLRQSRLVSRPAQILQWEAIVNDPIGALAAVLALEIVLVRQGSELGWGPAIATLAAGIGSAAALGLVGGWVLVVVFRRNLLPEFMKVPVIFVAVLAIFALADTLLHESGLLAVTIMGLVIANADLPSYTELRRFKEQVTILLVSGVFILLAAGVNTANLGLLGWRTALFVTLVVLVARPLAVGISLLGTDLPGRERLLIAFTGPRGVVMVAVAGVFGERLIAEGVPDGALVAPLAFVLVAATVVLHGFALGPMARALGLTSGDRPGLLIVGGSAFATAFARILQQSGVKVLIADPNHAHLRSAREAGIPVWYGDILAESAQNNVEFLAYPAVLVASDNDAYNTLVATDFGPEFGRAAIWQVARHREDRTRHALPSQFGGQSIRGNHTLAQYLDKLAAGWVFRATKLTGEYPLAEWRAARPGAIPLAVIDKEGFRMLCADDDIPDRPDLQVVSLLPAEVAERLGKETRTGATPKERAEAAAEAQAAHVRAAPESG